MKEQQRILVFRLSSLGDVALCVPVIMNVLEQNPELSIDFVTPKFMHDLFPVHNRLKFIDFDKKGKHQGILGLLSLLKSIDLKQYNAIADLHEVLRTKVLATASFLKGKKVVSIKKDRKARKALINGETSQPLKPTTEKYADVFRRLGFKLELDHHLKNYLFDSIPRTNKIGIAPFARHQGKMYPIDKLKEVVVALSKTNPIEIYGNKSELDDLKDWKSIGNIEFCKGNGLKDELKQMSGLQLMISMDSANMHLASLVGVPVVSIWGVTHPNAGFLGYGQSWEGIIQDENCQWRPTSVYGNKLGPSDNPTGFGGITPEMIINKTYEMLNK
ncbi:glycosyltransferase family 9 protein [Weeksellaceae bacterium KMM 9724]|uniref:glycosyltransferase family 9 protein n=1 Tax=Profundicola chukchiensis TaxID=2961959 RepID=UPI00243C9528|nr:glycosyltransferase family 9 protein [Profundicola chukchiensis]MDG4950838.1 glycosyltransferase family 9 protein [Profundicola chukchiensis]